MRGGGVVKAISYFHLFAVCVVTTGAVMNLANGRYEVAVWKFLFLFSTILAVRLFGRVEELREANENGKRIIRNQLGLLGMKGDR
jgi:hypothetical protein